MITEAVRLTRSIRARPLYRRQVFDVADCDIKAGDAWVRLHEKGGRQHEVPCQRSLEEYLDEYIAAARNRGPSGPANIPHYDWPAFRRGGRRRQG